MLLAGSLTNLIRDIGVEKMMSPMIPNNVGFWLFVCLCVSGGGRNNTAGSIQRVSIERGPAYNGNIPVKGP